MTDPFSDPAPPPGGPGRSTPLGDGPGYASPPGSSPPGYPSPPPGFGPSGPTPPRPGPAPGYGQPPGYGGPPVGQPGWAAPPKTGTNGLAIAGFVLALLWLCAVGSLLGIIFGFVALSQIKNSQQSGRGLAIAGIVLGILGIAATVLVLVFAVDKAEDVFEEDPEERDDVELIGCEPGPAGEVEAQLTITNDSSRSSSYLLNVIFTGNDGKVLIGNDSLGPVGPGETATETVTAAGDLSAGYRCSVGYVNRFADDGGD